jgi:DNA-binding HxlR family transcriptional regulator
MDQLPSSIATYLEEAGFSGTEILILRKLMDGEPLTIRQLGAKTGKSTGVLDQAMKKLIAKNIIRKTLINDVPKYALDSLEAVVEWMQEDMEQKREMLLRRHQNFESFVTSLESGSKRPDIEYFEGESGIKQAYIKLLNGPGEILHYLPVMYKEEEDPLRDFRVQYFRERQIRKMFSRVLAHDTVLGHRYQSRDAFEYRKTVLVPEKEYPFTFEKIITGDRIACFDHKAKTACVIRYPELADVERALFEAIWRQVQAKPTDAAASVIAKTAESEKIAFSTETMSQLREFFLSRRSLVGMGVCVALAAVTTFAFYQHNVAMNLTRLRERVLAVASTAALQFDLKDIEKIHTPEDIVKPEYAKLIQNLNRIRTENPGIAYAYIMRPTMDALKLEFVADADSLDPYQERDLNNDLVINDADHLTPPGELYNISSDSAFTQLMQGGGSAYANTEPYTDQWGTFITATAPIRDDDGNVRAMIGVDMNADQLYRLTNAQFQLIGYFLTFLCLYLLVRFMAFAPKRISFNFHFEKRSVLYATLFMCMAAYWLVFGYAYYRHSSEIAARGQRLMELATITASKIDPQDLEDLRWAKDMKTEQ